MLRGFVLVLVALNALFFAWTQGWLDGVIGVRAQGDREPDRLARQVNVQAVRLLTPTAVKASLAASAADAARAASSSAAAPATACLEAGPFTAAEIRTASQSLERAVPTVSWVGEPVSRPGLFIVYMGRYASDEALQRKAAELRRIRIDFEEIREIPTLEPGLMLGRFEDRAAAEQRLASLNERGVHTAKVVTLLPPVNGYLLRVTKAEPDMASKLLALKLKALGNGFAPCSAQASAAAR